MPARLSALDASFLYLEQPTTPMHVGAVAIFRRPRSRQSDGGLAYETLTELVEKRIALVPRYRQRVRHVPGNIARPVWIDDTHFDIAYHVRRSALPRPGSDEQLTELVARLASRPLDHERPLWEMYLIEGLARNRVALMTKTHQALVDGVGSIDILQVILDVTPEPRPFPEELWMPRPEPSATRLVLDALAEVVSRPGVAVENARAALGDAIATTRRLVSGLGRLAVMAVTAPRPAPGTPLNVGISTQRRCAFARTSLESFRRIRAAYGCSLSDVVLTVVAGALRNWLLLRGEAVTPSSRLRALVPLSMRGEDTSDGTTTSPPPDRMTTCLVDLPVGEPNPVVRLHQVRHAMREHTAGKATVSPDTLVRLGGFAPPTLHALGARAVSQFSRHIFNVVVTYVPGPQFPLYAAGARMLEIFPVVPLAPGQALTIGVTSYDGGLFFGFNGDREAMSDVEVLAGLVTETLDELLATVG